jgi:DNA-binding transcriptional MerR regulator
MAESMTITELAERVGMTPRNIRAYQSRGLLFAPEIRDRVARYSGAHAARLTLIASLQREGYTLAVVKSLLDNPDSYSAIVSDRRRRFHEGSSDIPETVPIPEDKIRALLPHLPEDLTETGLAWRDESGQLVSHSVLVAVGRTLASHGVAYETLSQMQLGAARTGREMGTILRRSLDGDGDADRVLDLSRLAMQLSAMAFELAFLAACTWDEEVVESQEG